MANLKSPKSYRLHFAKPIKEREEAAGSISPCTTRKMNFIEGIAVGMTPREALEKCEASTVADMTKKHLQLCADAGFKGEDIAKAYGVTKMLAYYYVKKFGVKLLPKPGGVCVVPGTPARQVSEASREVVPEIPSDGSPAAALPDQPAGETIQPLRIPENELLEVFGAKPEPELPPIDYYAGLPFKEYRIVAPKLRVYIAHPLRGDNPAANIARATEICRELYAEGKVVPVSPLHTFSFLDPMNCNHNLVMEWCFSLQDACDEMWIYGDWRKSAGILDELERAIRRGQPVRFMEGA